MNKKVLAENLRKAERDLLLCFVKGVILYRIAEETKQKVFKNWNSEDFEVELHAATKACNEMRDGVDESLDHLIHVVPELREYYAELKGSLKKIEEKEEKK